MMGLNESYKAMYGNMLMMSILRYLV